MTEAGGLFRSSSDHQVGVYFPVGAVQQPVNITIQVHKTTSAHFIPRNLIHLHFAQLEHISNEALEYARARNALVANLLAVGPLLHVRQDRVTEVHHQVALTIPLPSMMKHSSRGFMHILTFRENHTCMPCSAHYKKHKGYATLQTWHFTG